MVELALAEIIALTRRLTEKNAAHARRRVGQGRRRQPRGPRPDGSASSGTATSAPSCRCSPRTSACRCTSTTPPTSSPWATRTAAPRLDELLEVAGRGHAARRRPAGQQRVLRRGAVRPDAPAQPVPQPVPRLRRRPRGAARGTWTAGTSPAPRSTSSPSEPKGRGDEFVSELRGLPNVILTPHIGGSTEEAQADIGDFVANKLAQFVQRGQHHAERQPARRSRCRSSRARSRIAHVHRNTPGVLAQVNSILAEHEVNVEGQLLAHPRRVRLPDHRHRRRLLRRGARPAARDGPDRPPAGPFVSDLRRPSCVGDRRRARTCSSTPTCARRTRPTGPAASPARRAASCGPPPPPRWPRWCGRAPTAGRADHRAGRQHRPGRRRACRPAARCCSASPASPGSSRSTWSRRRSPRRRRHAGEAAGARPRGRARLRRRPGRAVGGHGRRPGRDQRRRHPGAALRQHARAGHRRRGGAGRRHGACSRLAGLAKDNTGYDLTQLLAGSEGTLAIITRVRLRLVPLLPARAVALVAVAGTGGGAGAARGRPRRARHRCPPPSSSRRRASIWSARTAGCPRRSPSRPGVRGAGVRRPAPTRPTTCSRCSASATAVRGRDGGLGRDRAWRGCGRTGRRTPRRSAPPGVPVKLDVCVPLRELAALVDELPGTVAAVAPGARVIIFGHLNEGNLHVNVLDAGEQRRAGQRRGAAPGRGAARQHQLRARRRPGQGALAVAVALGRRRSPRCAGSRTRSTRRARSTRACC